MLLPETQTPETVSPMPSLNHSYLCMEILRQLIAQPHLQPMVELTLDIDKGLTPDISVFEQNQIRPNFLKDVVRCPQMPRLAIEVISPRQAIEDVLDKAPVLLQAGVGAVWTIEPYGKSIFVATEAGNAIFHDAVVETQGIQVDFSQVFRVP